MIGGPFIDYSLVIPQVEFGSGWANSEATWRSGDVADCKSAYPGSIPGVASITPGFVGFFEAILSPAGTKVAWKTDGKSLSPAVKRCARGSALRA